MFSFPLLLKIAESIGKQVGSAQQFVRNNKDIIEQEYEKFTTTNPGFDICCLVNDTNFEKITYLNQRVLQPFYLIGFTPSNIIYTNFIMFLLN